MGGRSRDRETTTNDYSTLKPAIETAERHWDVGSGASMVIDVEAEPARKLHCSRFKGVVSQPNGRWGAQIYEKHQRVWLGTFNEEQEAAKSYNIALKRFRGRAVGGEAGDFEALFLNSHSKSEIVDMLRKHTYNDELERGRRRYCGPVKLSRNWPRFRHFHGGDTASRDRELLFEKVLTPSDVGKLNRLVIPKQHAEKHFSVQNMSMTSKGLLLNFEDMGGKVWRFRYSYWNSSQSYVLTKGWSRFVKVKNFRAGDVVSFQRSSGPDGHQLYIDRREANASDVAVASEESGLDRAVPIVRLFGVDIRCDSGGRRAFVEGEGCR